MSQPCDEIESPEYDKLFAEVVAERVAAGCTEREAREHAVEYCAQVCS